MKKITSCLLGLVGIIILVVAFNSYNTYLDKKISQLYKDGIAAKYGFMAKDKGMILQEIALNKGDLMILGSSELSSPVVQNPREFFPNDKMQRIVNVVGTARVQNFQHAVNIGAIDEYKNKSIVFVVSIQWFFEMAGIDEQNFLSKFSEVQFFEFMNDEEISKELKIRVAEKVEKLTRAVSQYQNVNIYSRLFINRDKNILSKLASYVCEPYFDMRNKYLVLKDKTDAIREIKNLKDIKTYSNNKIINWEEQYRLAEEQGRAVTTNNEYFIENEYYDTYIRSKHSEFKDEYIKYNYAEKIIKSVEHEDFKLFLDVCKEKNINPYIVLMPVNGKFYDHLGLNKEDREKFYSKVEQTIKPYGFEVLNMSSKEYEPYYLTDHMHLGWKGWLDIDERIINHVK